MAAAETLKTSYRIAKIETVEAPGNPGMPPVKKVKVTGVPLQDPIALASAGPAGGGAASTTYEWLFDDVTAAAQFFNVDEVVELVFTKVADQAAPAA